MFAVASTTACAQRTDTTVAVQPNVRVQIQNFAGSVVVRTWDRAAVRVVTAQRRPENVQIRGRDGVLAISTVARTGVPAPLDYEITVPARASLDIGGTYTSITIEGTRGPVSATTVQGDVSLRGGDGVVSLKSVEGTVTVQDASGRVELNGVNKGLVLRNIDGDIAAETVNGSIVLEGIQSSDVEAVTVNGRVTYDGTIRDRGRYRFGSHNGSVTVSIPERANATIAATTYQGTFSSRFSLPPAAEDESSGPRRRANFAFGSGSARVEVESFQGNIILVRPGDSTVKQR
jgi:DUF4097 and DUF4098 domain-containing protein YvlB